jgi:hypothetical protein
MEEEKKKKEEEEEEEEKECLEEQAWWLWSLGCSAKGNMWYLTLGSTSPWAGIVSSVALALHTCKSSLPKSVDASLCF